MRLTLKNLSRIGAAVALLAILVATLTPGKPSASAGWQWCLVCGERGVADVLVNIVLFIPLGAALGAAGLGWWRVLALGVALSTSIEYAQLFIPGRDSSLSDVCTNTAGALIGWELARWLSVALRRRIRPSLGSATLTAALSAGVIVATGFLTRPDFPPTTYFAMWTPDLGHLEFYRGHVLQATLDSVSLPPDEVPASKHVRSRLEARATLRVRALAGPEPSRLAPLFSIFDNSQQEVLLLGAQHSDLVYQYRTRALSWRLNTPDIRVTRDLQNLAPGDTVDITVSPDEGGYCIRLNGRATCGLGFTAGTGWTMLLYPESAPQWFKTLLNIGWLAGLWLPAGFWGASRWGAAIVTTASVAALGVVAPAMGLLHTPLMEWIGSACGIVAGVACREAIVRRPPTRS